MSSTEWATEAERAQFRERRRSGVLRSEGVYACGVGSEAEPVVGAGQVAWRGRCTTGRINGQWIRQVKGDLLVTWAALL